MNGKGTLVEIEFSIGKKEYLVRRGIKPNIFEIHVDGKLVDQNADAKEYQEYFETQILKLNHKSFSQIVVLGSASFVPFMQLTAANRREIVEDLLEPKELKVDTINFISELSIITIDLVKTIIQEVNIHKETPYNFSDVFNVHGNERLYKVTQLLEDGTMEVLFPRCMLDTDYVNIPFSNMDIGNSIYLNGKYQGSIREIVNATTVDVERRVEKSGDESMETRRLNFSLQSRVHYSFKGKSIGLW